MPVVGAPVRAHEEEVECEVCLADDAHESVCNAQCCQNGRAGFSSIVVAAGVGGEEVPNNMGPLMAQDHADDDPADLFSPDDEPGPPCAGGAG